MGVKPSSLQLEVRTRGSQSTKKKVGQTALCGRTGWVAGMKWSLLSSPICATQADEEKELKTKE